MSIPSVVNEFQGLSPISTPYAKIAAAAFVICALGAIFLGLHYSHLNGFIFKDIEDLPTETLLEVDIPAIVVFGGIGVDRGVISIRYHNWAKEKHAAPPGDDEEKFDEGKRRFIVLTSERGPASPRGVFEIAYHQLQKIAGSLVSLARWFSVDQKQFEKDKGVLLEEGYEVQEVTLERDGISYQGFTVTSKNLSQDRWAIQAVGITGCAQKSLLEMGKAYGEVGFNLLIVNPPGVGGSQGRTTGKTLGQAQETGLRFLEHRGAKQVILAGFSLGGGMMGSAVVQHKFKNDIRYLALFQMTFSCLSKAAASLIRGGIQGFSKVVPMGPFPSYFGGAVGGIGVRLLGMEMDSVAAVQKLTEENSIPVIVVQKSRNNEAGWKGFNDVQFASDGIILEKATLGKGLQEAKLTNTNLIFPYTPDTQDLWLAHDTPPQKVVTAPLQMAKTILPENTHAGFFTQQN